MNKNIDLTKILKDCPKGFVLYSSIHGKVLFYQIDEYNLDYPIECRDYKGDYISFSKEGYLHNEYSDVECVLVPSKEQKDWSKFTAPWYKKEKFDPKTLHPYDKVLVRDSRSDKWRCQLFSHILKDDDYFCACIYSSYRYGNCIPYNDDTKHLIGTTDEVNEFYRYWEE